MALFATETWTMRHRLLLTIGAILVVCQLISVFWLWHESKEQIQLLVASAIEGHNNQKHVEHEVREAVASLLVPSLLIVGLALYISMLAVRKITRPLSRLQSELESRTPDNLTPIVLSESVPEVTAVTAGGDLLSSWFVAGGSDAQPSVIEVQAAMDEAAEALAAAGHDVGRVRFAIATAGQRLREAAQVTAIALERLHDSDAQMSALAEQLGTLAQSGRGARAEAARLEQAMASGAREISADAWERGPRLRRILNWAAYGLVRLMIGIAGYGNRH